jgi:signal transduction histidine kinase
VNSVVLIQLASALLSAALAAAIAAREPGQRANRLMAAFLLCNVWWALCQLLWVTAADAVTALRFARAALLGTSLLSPLAFDLLLSLLPDALRPMRRLLIPAYALAFVAMIVSVSGPGIVLRMQPMPWGHATVAGPLLIAGGLVLAAIPATALLRVLWLGRPADRPRPLTQPWLELALGLPLLVTATADVLLPALGYRLPQVGPTSIALAGALTWFGIYRFRGARLSPRQFASEILDTLPDGVALVRLDGRIRAVNAKLAQLAQRPAAELVGRPLAELIAEPAAAEGGEREGELVTVSNARLPVSLSDGFLHDSSGEAIGRVFLVRHLEELLSLRNRLLGSGRLAAVGQLAAGIAHEINNPIAYVRSNLSLLERHWKTLAKTFESRGPTPEQRAALARSRELLLATGEGIDRVASVVRDVGGFSSKGGAENELADLVELLEAAVRVAGPQLRRKATVERALAKLPLIPCRPQELMQVFLDLVLAGVHAIDERGRLRLSAGAEGANAWVEIAVDGAGLSPDALERIFDPFPSARGGPAVGLGLAISRQLVERQGGRILVESRPGRAMRFRVSLPTAGAASGSGD